MHSLHEEVEKLVEAKSGEDWSSERFCDELKKRLGPKVGSRVLRCSPSGYGSSETAYINFYNVDKVDGQAGGGAVAANNRAMFSVDGFGKEAGQPSPRGKVKFKVDVWSFDFDWLDKKLKRPRGKTAAPAKILDTIVKTVEAIMKLEPRLG